MSQKKATCLEKERCSLSARAFIFVTISSSKLIVTVMAIRCKQVSYTVKHFYCFLIKIIKSLSTMPNQRAADKQSVTVSMPKKLVAAIDKLAKEDRRSRTQMIELLLESEIERNANTAAHLKHGMIRPKSTDYGAILEGTHKDAPKKAAAKGAKKSSADSGVRASG
jgi:predicted transcriptional regulator